MKNAADRAAANRDVGDPKRADPRGADLGNAVIPDGASGGKGWYSRGYLPHFDQPGLYQSINFRLHDAVPAHVIAQWKEELRWRENLPGDHPTVVALRRRLAQYEDTGHGACWLRDSRVAALVQQALWYFDGERYQLIAWCVMPNHVHVLIETWAGYPLDKVLHSWKSFTSQEANVLLKRTGAFWGREYYDRFMRDEQHFAHTVRYIEQNPVKAGLTQAAEDWLYSSAAHHR